MHSLCGAVKMRCEHFSSFIIFFVAIYPLNVRKNLAHPSFYQLKKKGQNVSVVFVNKFQKRRRNVTLERLVAFSEQSQRQKRLGGSEKVEWVSFFFFFFFLNAHYHNINEVYCTNV